MRIAILGYGNIGRAAEQAIKSAPDMELAGIYHHNDNLDDIQADAVLLCTPTREVEPLLKRCYREGYVRWTRLISTSRYLIFANR